MSDAETFTHDEIFFRSVLIYKPDTLSVLLQFCQLFYFSKIVDYFIDNHYFT